MITPPRYAMPDGDPKRLLEKPQLASWEVASHPGQLKLKAYLEATEKLTVPLLESLSGPLALRLDVGLDADLSLLEHHDVDNFLFPLVSHLRQKSGRDFVSVWATKAVGSTSSIRIDQARPADEERTPQLSHHVRTTASSDSVLYKQQIHDQLWYATALPDGPVQLEVAFVVGQQRKWLNLWKPTIDALGPLLGSAQGAKPWNPRDGRITRIGLHCAVDTGLGNDVLIGIAAAAEGSRGGSPQR